MTLAAWLDRDSVATRLTARGMSADSAAKVASCFAETAAALKASGIDSGAGVVACWSPGRIEVFGKHTDYCGGESILATVERGFAIIAVARNDDRVRMLNVRGADTCDFSLDASLEPPIGHWSNYPQTVARRLARNFPNARRGATIAFASNLPQSSGMSSSSAFVVGTFLVLSKINRLENDTKFSELIRTRAELAGYLGTVENGLSFGPFAGDRGVGTFGGSEDHTGILCGEPDRLVQYAYCPVRFRRAIGLSGELAFALASSGVVAEKTGAALKKYNRVSAMVRMIVSTWQNTTGSEQPSLSAILESTPDAADRLQKVLADNSQTAFSVDDLLERLYHFQTETALLRAVPDAIDSATIGAFGNLAYESHQNADLHLKNQTRETNRLVAIAKELGAPAASAFGAGFGGSVWAIVPRTSATPFLSEWQARYQREFPEPAARSEFLLTRPGVPAFTETVSADS